jgi:uncharacterized protein YbbC (DUF1343 family)
MNRFQIYISKALLFFIRVKKYGFIFFIMLFFDCSGQVSEVEQPIKKNIQTGAEQLSVYLPMLDGKSVGVVANQTSMVGNRHLVDTLLSRGVKVVKVFSPEHGFRGSADAGEMVNSQVDQKTGLPIVSLYGNNKKPKASDLKDVDIVIFDIQDVGARFYTYISTMHYVMEACAENVKEVLILDRPNPNGFYVAGPVLDKKHKSFVGMHPVPVVHGMTIVEYALMINQEGWLKNGSKCILEYVKCENYSHKDFYQLPIKPSPNLPNMASIYLYPSMCFFEGTVVSLGRGTDKPFQIYGHPKLTNGTFEFIPIARDGAKNPPLKGEVCKGFDVTNYADSIKLNGKLYLNFILDAYRYFPKEESFFLENGFVNLLSGTASFKDGIVSGKTQAEFEQSWFDDINHFKKIRKKYLLYEDFE